MNRRKKGLQILKAKDKKANAKRAPKKKSSYVSKAERAKIAAESAQNGGKNPNNSAD